MNGEEELLKTVARLEKLGKDKIESKKDYNWSCTCFCTKVYVIEWP